MTNEITVSNRVAGNGQHSHKVPTEIGLVILIRDGQHKGTEVYAVEGRDGYEYRFVSLDWDEVHTTERCVLVRLTGIDVNDLERPYGCDLEIPDGLALIGLDFDDSTEGLGEILWDSASA